MKKIVLACSMLALVVLASCKKEVPPPPPPPEPQVVVLPPPPPPPPAPVKAEEDKDGTSVSVGKDGVEINSKNGDKKTVIDMKDGKTNIEIKK